MGGANQLQNEGGKDDNALYEISVKSLEYISLQSNVKIMQADKCFDDDLDGTKTAKHFYRLTACDVLRECMDCMKINDMNKAQDALKALMSSIKSDKRISSKDKFIEGLLEDLSGQCFEAISKNEFYNKWGKHYLPSLVFAHLHQFNNNFKDPGVQNYGGKLFDELRDKANDIFIGLPPPKPSRPQYQAYHGGYGGRGGGGGGGKRKKKAAAAAPVNMRNYYNASGGCFDGKCKVLMGNGSLQKVEDLKRGDVVFGGARIQCVVKHECKDGQIVMSRVNDTLLITPYHPIVVGNEWVFPVDIGCEEVIECAYVYNFVLSFGHILRVEGVECCTLGHGLKSNAVIEHAYFGTNKVVDDLQKINGWKTGVVTLNGGVFERDAMSQMVQGMAV